MSISVTISALQKNDLIATTERLSIPTTTGRIEILPNHVPLLTALDVGVLEWGKAGASCNRIVNHQGLAIVVKNQITVYLQGWQEAESIEEISGKIPEINNKIATIKSEIDVLKSKTGNLEEVLKKEHLLGLEKARIDLARRVGITV